MIYQNAYEAQILLYRCLERLHVREDDVTVLHSFKYNKKQGLPGVNDGDHDFLVIVEGKGCIGFEVKGPCFDGMDDLKILKTFSFFFDDFGFFF